MASPRPHILVVDDLRELVELFREVFEAEEGYRVTTRALPFADLDEVARLAPDLILLDLVLGGEEDGLHLLDRLKRDPRTAAIPVVVCTAAARLLAREGAQLAEWSCAVIEKPFDLDRLLAAVADCLARTPGDTALGA